MYNHLTKHQRIELGVILRSGSSLRSAAQLLGVHHSTLSRELKRNPYSRIGSITGYHASIAHRYAKARRHKANQHFRKIAPGSTPETILVDKIAKQKWAPEQIAGWLRTYRLRLYVCAQTIYDWIYASRRDLLPFLHCRKGKYRRTRANRVRKAKRAALAAHRSIDSRPKHILYRKTYGHWEGDTVHGKDKSGYIATFVERKSGYLLAAVLPDITSGSFASTTLQCLEEIPKKYCKTLTLDNGPEMKLPGTIERDAGAKVFYAHPYHSWERGTNENTNGLLRYFFPKKSSFAALSQEELDQAVHLINTRPRKRLNWRTPEQVFKSKW